MVEAFFALVAAVLCIAVFKAPQALIRLGEYGGLAFVFYILILMAEWILGKARP